MNTARSLTAALDPAGEGMTRETVDAYVATLTLTPSQAWTVRDIVPSAEELDRQWWDNAPGQLAAVSRATAREPHHADHGELADLCEKLAPPQGLALVDAIVRSRSIRSDYVQALRAVGLIR